ncbi:MAG: phenylalanine--tRNA ligase beta subunit-related protein, partial [Candidatus Taylorbacteria bacterium]
MKISYNWLQTYFAKPLPSPEKLEELFIFHACEVESMENVGFRGKNNDGMEREIRDTILDLKVLPDRAHYALCHKGIAGEVFSLTQIPRIAKQPVVIKESTEKKPSIAIEAKVFCRRYVGRYVEIAKIGRSPIEIESALNAIDQRTIIPIVDATNYVMFDIGQPLHAFDADKVKGSIVVRKAKNGEKIVLLESSVAHPFGESSSSPQTPQGAIVEKLSTQAGAREVELNESDYVIADDLGPLAIAGVKGGKRAAISNDTKRLILESANFSPAEVRKTSTKYDLRSESSKRFENEITPELALDGMNKLSALIKEMDPNAKFGPIVDVYPVKAVQKIIDFDPVYLEERLGIKIPIKISKKILENMGIIIETPQGVQQNWTPFVSGELPEESMWKLTIPFNRLDLNIREDIVEEIGRIYGYEHINGVLPPKLEG